MKSREQCCDDSQRCMNYTTALWKVQSKLVCVSHLLPYCMEVQPVQLIGISIEEISMLLPRKIANRHLTIILSVVGIFFPFWFLVLVNIESKKKKSDSSYWCRTSFFPQTKNVEQISLYFWLVINYSILLPLFFKQGSFIIKCNLSTKTQ